MRLAHTVWAHHLTHCHSTPSQVITAHYHELNADVAHYYELHADAAHYYTLLWHTIVGYYGTLLRATR